ncbi:hypothetical protein VM1G_10513 [Cytospora mali]|uniref:RRM domain-containing protein n=1 Tax=Cytospora mali TaxID=578113 RepID=A0A194VHV7_CYTMA|nr:hypothetical protein VM1G_10513 [Valsa mali]
MAYDRPRRSYEPPSTDPEVHNKDTPDAADSHSSKARTSETPESDGVGSAPDEPWSIIPTSTPHETHHGLSGPVQQTPTPQPRNLTPSVFAAEHTPLGSLQEELLLRKLRGLIAQPLQTRPNNSLPRPGQQHSDRRNYTAPLRMPRIPGCVHPYASRSPSSPEKRSPEKPFYRPMTGISPLAQAPPARPLYYDPRFTSHGAPGAPIRMVAGNHNLDGEAVSTNDSTYNETNQAFINKVSLGFSPAYGGDPHLERNRSANIPNELNCSLFMVNLPPNLTTHRLISAIHSMGPTGRIYATHINAPEPDRQHYGCAAKVIFFERNAAHHFFDLCEEHGFIIDGFSARVMWNRIKTAQQAHARNTTRVLLIAGDRTFVNPSALTEYFRTKLQFQIDCIIPHGDGLDGKNAVVEYRFGSFRCQAEAAKMALVREHEDVKCYFHPDPCEPGHSGWAAGGFRWPRTKPTHRLVTRLEPVPED